MEHEFWHERWAKGETAFHETQYNPALTEHWHQLSISLPKRILVPLCGKSLDLVWLAEQGHEVIGVELSELAVQEFFSEQGLAPEKSKVGEHTQYVHGNISIWVGDFFATQANRIGQIDAVYDRAALVALPADMRQRYTQHLVALGGNAPQLLVTFDYDQAQMSGPPFALSSAEIHRHYDQYYAITLLARNTVPGNLKNTPAEECVWLLQREAV